MAGDHRRPRFRLVADHPPADRADRGRVPVGAGRRLLVGAPGRRRPLGGRPAWQAFRAGLANLGEDGMWRQLGPDWGPYATDTWTALALHVMDEIVHHGAEIALLRDLYPRLTTAE